MQDIISTLKNALQQAEAGLEVAVGRLAKDSTNRGDFKPSEVLALACVREALAMPVTCLHQIQEPAPVQAAHAAVAVPGHVKALHDAEARLTLLIERGKGKLLDVVARDACRAALVATPAAVAPLVLPEPAGEAVDVFKDGKHVDIEWFGKPPAHGTKVFTDQQLRALLPGVSAPAAQAGFVPAAAYDRLQALCDSQAARILAVEDANPVHWLAVLDPEQVPHQLKTSMHAVGFRNPRSAESWIAERLDFDGWRYTLEPLYSAPKAQSDARDAQLLAFAVSEIRRDEMTDSALLDAMEQKRIAVVPEYEGPWDAEIYNDEGKPNHRGSGSTPREAIRAAIAAQAAQQGGAA